jgi:hypothetical protein
VFLAIDDAYSLNSHDLSPTQCDNYESIIDHDSNKPIKNFITFHFTSIAFMAPQLLVASIAATEIGLLPVFTEDFSRVSSRAPPA